MEEDLTLTEELQSATLREMSRIRHRIDVVIFVILLPLILAVLALVVGVFAGLI